MRSLIVVVIIPDKNEWLKFREKPLRKDDQQKVSKEDEHCSKLIGE